MVNRPIEPYPGQAIRPCAFVAARLFHVASLCGFGTSRTSWRRGMKMRNIIMGLLAAPILFGCLGGEETSLTDPGIAGDPSGNNAPTIAGNPWSAILYGDMYDFEPNASDADGDTLTFDVQNKPNWANFDSSTGRLHGQPTLGDIGVYDDIVISVSDGTSSASLRSYSVSVSQTGPASFTLSWIPPTLNNDGSPLLDLAGYTIYYGRNSRGYDHEIRIDNASTQNPKVFRHYLQK